MRSRIDFIASRMEANLEESGTRIMLAWNIWPANTPRDPVSRQFIGTPSPGREEVNAFLHFVSATASVRQFNEIQVGDCIVDLSATLDLTNRDGLTFLLPSGPGGRVESWSNKPISSQLASYWDALQSGTRVCQTVLLRRST